MFNTAKGFLFAAFLIASTISTSCLGDWASMTTPAKHGAVAASVGIAAILGNTAASYFNINRAPSCCGKRYTALMGAAVSLAFLYSAGAFCVVSYQTKKEERNWADSYLTPTVFVAAVAFVALNIKQMLYYHNNPFAD